MRLIGWRVILSLLLVMTASLAVGDISTVQSALEQSHSVAQAPSAGPECPSTWWAISRWVPYAFQGAARSGEGWVIWAEWLCPAGRSRQRRNPLRRLQRLMRLAARRQRRRGQSRARRRSRPVGSPRPDLLAAVPASQAPTAPASSVEMPPARASTGCGRPPTIPTNHVFCPVEGCRGFEKLGPDPDHWIVGAGTYPTRANGRRQLYKCEWCQSRFSETKGTVFYGLKAPEETVYRALKALAEGVSIRSTARIFDVEVDTVLHWLRRAGEHSEKVSTYLMRNMQVEQAQLDELWTFVRKKQKVLSAWEKVHTEWGDTWVWVVFDPVSKLVLAILIGDRETEQAVGVLSRFKACLVAGCLPVLTSDQLPHYVQAILQVFGRWVQPKRKGNRGPHPKPRLEPPEELQYATVNKERRKGRVVSVTTQVIYGDEETIKARIAASMSGVKINTSFVERMNLTLRHLVSRLRRRGLTFSKKREFLAWHLHLAVAYYHFVRPHGSLRRRLPQPIPTRGNGSPKKWEPCTPAMAGGLTDHVWTMKELLTFRVPAGAG